MSLVAVGVTHRTADLSLLERLAAPGDEIPKALQALTALDHVVEAVVLSTCNRVEIYAHVTRFHAAVDELRGWLAARGQLDEPVLDAITEWRFDEEAAAHLFAVAAGLDSMVLGEQQIAVQVREALKDARAEGAARRLLQRLFNQAIATGRRVRRETAIGQGASSIVDVGLELAASSLGGPLAGAATLLVGAGKLGGLSAARLVAAGASPILVWNRSPDKAQRLADRVGGRVVEPGGLAAALAAAELVVTTTGAAVPLLDVEMLDAAVAGRRERPLAVLDLGVPRNVAPACRDLEGVALHDIRDVRDVADRDVAGPVLDRARAIVEEEARLFTASTSAATVEPAIRDLRAHAERVRQAETARLGARLAGLDERQRAAVDALTRGILNTLLHGPTVRLKELAAAEGAEHHAAALRDLFDLDDE